MRASRPLALAAGVSAIALASLLVASPASAATLPSGQRITVVQANPTPEGQQGPPFSQYWEVSPADAASTPGGIIGGLVFFEGIDVNDDGVGYAVRISDDDGFASYIHPVNAANGTAGAGVEITPADGYEIAINTCRGIDYLPSGQVLATCTYFNGDVITESHIGFIDPASGDFTPVISDAGPDENPTVDWRAIAYNGTNGDIWAFGLNLDSGDPEGFSVDLSDPSVAPGIVTDQVINSADFDRDGQLFVVWLPEGPPRLGTVVPSTGVVTDIGLYSFEESDVENVRAITVWGKPALPATGPDFVVPIGLGTALLFLAGAAFIATSRIQRRAE